MKWQLDKARYLEVSPILTDPNASPPTVVGDVYSDAKAAVHRWPYQLYDGDGVRICQRTHVDGFTMYDPIADVTTGFKDPSGSTDYKHRPKMRVRQPTDADPSLLRHFWSRPHRYSVRKEFEIDFTVPTDAPDGTYNPWWNGGNPMSDPRPLLYQRDEGGTPKTVTWYAYGVPMDTTGGDADGADFTSFPLRSINDEHDTWPKYYFRPKLSCRRVLVYDNISHGLDAEDAPWYPEDVLHAASTEVSPAGALWRLRPKGNKILPDATAWNPDSDIRFEPFAWPADGCEFRRYLAAKCGLDAPIFPAGLSSTTGAAGDGIVGGVECASFEGVVAAWNTKLSGRRLFFGLQAAATALGETFTAKIPAGVPHTLILIADVWTVTKWEWSDATTKVKTPRYALFGIYGHAIAIL